MLQSPSLKIDTLGLFCPRVVIVLFIFDGGTVWIISP